jgi:hypothetical protein
LSKNLKPLDTGEPYLGTKLIIRRGKCESEVGRTMVEGCSKAVHASVGEVTATSVSNAHSLITLNHRVSPKNRYSEYIH